MTTLLRRLMVPVLVFLVWAPAAHAWSWPVQGPVLQPFAYDESHPYDAGQHRGVDIGADATGETVRAPADGTVSFAGTVPTNGESITIETADGYSVTLTHLGSIAVAKGGVVAEGDKIGTIGPSGTAETDGPYVHLGIRITADPDGYVDPLSLLPPTADAGGGESESGATQPSASGGSSSATAPSNQPAPAPTAATPVASSHGSAVQVRETRDSRPARSRRRTQAARTRARPQASTQRLPVSRPAAAGAGLAHRPRLPHRHVSEPVSAWRRPVVEAAAPHEPADLGAGHELRPSMPVALAGRQSRQDSSALSGIVCNGAAALVAVAAAFAAARRRRRALTGTVAEVLHLPTPAHDRRMRRAA